MLTVHKAQGSQWDDVVLFDESFAFQDSRKVAVYGHHARGEAVERGGVGAQLSELVMAGLDPAIHDFPLQQIHGRCMSLAQLSGFISQFQVSSFFDPSNSSDFIP